MRTANKSAARGRWAPAAPVLAAAARAVAEVARGRSAAALTPAEDSAVRAVTLGTLRWYLRLAPAVEALLDARQTLAPAVKALLVVAAHQIEYSRNAPAATVHAAVDAVRILGQARASSLVNAVLRRFVAERATLMPRLDADLAIASAHPRWLVEALEHAWPAQVAALLAGANEHPPLIVRVDRTRLTVEEYLAQLADAGLEASALGWAPSAARLERAVPVEAIPGFREGRVSVQDAGAQLAAPLLDARAGMRVLDACAAPGGKTLHLLEHTPQLAELVAVDVDAQRLQRVRENLERARPGARWADASVQLCAVDARELGRAQLPGRSAALFDRVLLDAPCSSTGVIRRHPDIKLLRRADDIERLAATQLEILGAAFRCLAPGGRLLYSTCSVLPAENEQVVAQFVASEPAARPAAMPSAGTLAPGAVDCSVGVQLLPGAGAGTDGFYYACLEKTTAGN
jgi:16S rRNA (cytosine967-C5)-methyltransferase